MIFNQLRINNSLFIFVYFVSFIPTKRLKVRRFSLKRAVRRIFNSFFRSYKTWFFTFIPNMRFIPDIFIGQMPFIPDIFIQLCLLFIAYYTTEAIFIPNISFIPTKFLESCIYAFVHQDIGGHCAIVALWGQIFHIYYLKFYNFYAILAYNR